MWSVLHQRIHVHKTVTGAHVADRRRWQPDQRHHSRKLERAQCSTCGRSRCFVSSVRCLNCMSQANFGTSPTLALTWLSQKVPTTGNDIGSAYTVESLRIRCVSGSCLAAASGKARSEQGRNFVPSAKTASERCSALRGSFADYPDQQCSYGRRPAGHCRWPPPAVAAAVAFSGLGGLQGDPWRWQ